MAIIAASSLLTGCATTLRHDVMHGAIAYVANLAGQADPGTTLAVVNTATSTALTPVTTGTLPSAMAATPNGESLLVVDKGQDQLVEVDTSTGHIVGRASVGLEPDAVAVSPNGSLALVANFGNNTVTPVALPSLQAGDPIAVGREPVAVAIAPDGKLALVANYEDGTVTPIALPSLVPGAAIAAGSEPDAVLITPNSAAGLVADFQTSVVTPIDLSKMVPATAIPVAGNPTGIASWRSDTVVYVSGGSSVTPIDLLPLLQAGAPIPVGTTAQGLALANGGRTAWVCSGNGTLVPVNLVTGTVGKPVVVGGQPTAVVIPSPVSSR